jgi:hypothetical protein
MLTAREKVNAVLDRFVKFKWHRVAAQASHSERQMRNQRVSIPLGPRLLSEIAEEVTMSTSSRCCSHGFHEATGL